jgi:hypothetical protein
VISIDEEPRAIGNQRRLAAEALGNDLLRRTPAVDRIECQSAGGNLDRSPLMTFRMAADAPPATTG